MRAKQAASGALVLVTWLPEPEEEGLTAKRATQQQKQQKMNEAHVAGASAATQNLLLSVEARGFSHHQDRLSYPFLCANISRMAYSIVQTQ